MERQQLLQLIQGYLGMNPADKGCVNWNDMQQRMADEILALLASNSNLRKKPKATSTTE